MRVADCDYFLRCGNTDLTTHHVVVVPDTPLYNANMNDSSITTGGYVGSKMRTVHLRRAEAIFKACFGESHVLKHREYLVNAVLQNTSIDAGKETDGAWYDSLVELMDERMVYGTASSANTALPSVSNKQLTLFKDSSYRKNKGFYCLRNCKYFYFVFITNSGDRDRQKANISYGVRPYALIY